MILEEIGQPDLKPSILCPHCGVKFTPSINNICPTCTVTKTDITLGITKESVLNFCRFCRRYLRPPWVLCERESRQLLAICLRKIKGLNRVKLISAAFIWTEPHSKRIKVKVTVSKEVSNLSLIQQSFIVQFIEAYTQCDDCKKQFTPHTWGAVVQVRQHVEHKKTFFLIEQLILKHNAHEKVLKVDQQDDGINFYYKNSTHAQRLIDFLGSLLPINVIPSKQLISHDESSNIFVYKYGFSVQIPRICRDDLVLIPKKLATILGGCSQLLLCLKVSTMMTLLDLSSFKLIYMNSQQYDHHDKDIQLLPLSTYKSQFAVLDCTPANAYKKKFSKKSSKKQESTMQVQASNNDLNTSTATKSTSNLYVSLPTHEAVIAKEADWESITVRTHLSELGVGHFVEAFDLRSLNFTQEISNFKGVDQVVLVKKAKEPHRKRAFKLHRLEQQGVMVEQKQRKKKPKVMEKEERQFEQFMDEVAENKQLRKGVKMYKDQQVLDNLKEHEKKDVLGEIELCELLDELKINDAQPNTYQNDLQGIDELIQKMEKITLDKQE